MLKMWMWILYAIAVFFASVNVLYRMVEGYGICMAAGWYGTYVFLSIVALGLVGMMVWLTWKLRPDSMRKKYKPTIREAKNQGEPTQPPPKPTSAPPKL